MAITFKGHVTGSSTNGNNITLNLASPTSGSAPSAGDVVLAVSISFNRSGNEGRIGNALSYAETHNFTGASRRHRAAWKAWASGENSVVVEGTANSADGMAAVAVWFSGADTSSPFSVTSTTASGSSTNPNPAAIVPADNNCAIVVLAGSGANDSAPGTIASYTVLSGVAGNDTNPNSAAVAYRILSGGSGVSEDPAAFSAWISGGWYVVTAAIKEASAAVTLTAAAGSYTVTGAATAAFTLLDVGNLPAGGGDWFYPWRPRQGREDFVRRRSPQFLVTATAFAADAGSYTVSGTAAISALGQTADSGSYSTTGSTADLALRYVAGAGAYNVTGDTAAQTLGHVAEAGAYALTGSAASVGGVEEVAYAPGWTEWFNPWAPPYPVALRTWIGPAPSTVTYIFRPPLITRNWAPRPRDYWIWSVAYQVGETLSAGGGAYALTGSDAQLTVSGTITLTCEAGSYNLTGSDITFVGVEVTPPEVSPPLPGGVGGRPRYKKYPLKQKRKRKRDECEELLEYLRSLPPAEAQAAVELLPPSSLSLLDGMPLPHAIRLPPSIDDDEDECALLLEMLLS